MYSFVRFWRGVAWGEAAFPFMTRRLYLEPPMLFYFDSAPKIKPLSAWNIPVFSKYTRKPGTTAWSRQLPLCQLEGPAPSKKFVFKSAGRALPAWSHNFSCSLLLCLFLYLPQAHTERNIFYNPVANQSYKCTNKPLKTQSEFLQLVQ